MKWKRAVYLMLVATVVGEWTMPRSVAEGGIPAEVRPMRAKSRFDTDDNGRLDAAERRAMLKALNDPKKSALETPGASPPRKAPAHRDRRQERISRAIR